MRDPEKLSKTELINLVEKLHSKARKPKIAIVDYDNKQVPQIRENQKPPKPKRPPPPPLMKEHITDVPSSKIKELNQALSAMQSRIG